MKKILFILCLLCAFTPQISQAAKAKSKQVVLIALDGWGAYSLKKAKVPNIRSVMSRGCYSLHNRSVLPSVSAVNWASMFMGVGTESHGYTQWNSKRPEIPSTAQNAHGIFPTIFSLIAEQMPQAETGCLYEWDGIKYLIDTLAVKHYAIAPDYDNHPTLLCEMAERYIKESHPQFLAVCFDQVDEAGHRYGHDTPEYYAALERVDGYVGRIIQALKDAGTYDNTVIILTADHGGINKGHGGKTLQEMEIPFIIAGKGIKNSGEIKDCIMQYDTPATIAYILGLQRPQPWVGRPVMSVFK